MDFTKLSYNDHALFHMLRHFEYINDNARNCLLERGYQHKAINENLAIPGSKFDQEFASDIKSLLIQFSGKQIIETRETQKYLELVFRFSKPQFPTGIGSLGVYDKNKLAQISTKEPYRKWNRGQFLWHAIVEELPRTEFLTVVVNLQATAHFLITAFPGLPTMPLPNKKMKQSVYEAALSYWEEKVFLEESEEIKDKR